MKVNLPTAFVIQRNTVRTFAMGPFPNGKYGSVTYLMKKDSAVKPLISIKDGEFYSCKEAIDRLDGVVKSIRELDLPLQKEELENL